METTWILGDDQRWLFAAAAAAATNTNDNKFFIAQQPSDAAETMLDEYITQACMLLCHCAGGATSAIYSCSHYKAEPEAVLCRVQCTLPVQCRYRP